MSAHHVLGNKKYQNFNDFQKINSTKRSIKTFYRTVT